MDKTEGVKAVVLILLLVIILSAAIVFIQFSQKTLKEQTPKEEQAMNLIKQDKIYLEYIEGKDFTEKITFLSSEEVKKVNEEWELGLEEKELVQVEFIHPQLGNFTAFVDLDNGTEKIYRITGVTMK